MEKDESDRGERKAADASHPSPASRSATVTDSRSAFAGYAQTPDLPHRDSARDPAALEVALSGLGAASASSGHTAPHGVLIARQAIERARTTLEGLANERAGDWDPDGPAEIELASTIQGAHAGLLRAVQFLYAADDQGLDWALRLSQATEALSEVKTSLRQLDRPNSTPIARATGDLDLAIVALTATPTTEERQAVPARGVMTRGVPWGNSNVGSAAHTQDSAHSGSGTSADSGRIVALRDTELASAPISEPPSGPTTLAAMMAPLPRPAALPTEPAPDEAVASAARFAERTRSDPTRRAASSGPAFDISQGPSLDKLRATLAEETTRDNARPARVSEPPAAGLRYAASAAYGFAKNQGAPKGPPPLPGQKLPDDVDASAQGTMPTRADAPEPESRSVAAPVESTARISAAATTASDSPPARETFETSEAPAQTIPTPAPVLPRPSFAQARCVKIHSSRANLLPQRVPLSRQRGHPDRPRLKTTTRSSRPLQSVRAMRTNVAGGIPPNVAFNSCDRTR
jgi:hypothetical protein